MTNEELLVQIGRIIGETVKSSEERMKAELKECIKDVEARLSFRFDQVEVELKVVHNSVNHLTERVVGLENSMRQVKYETEKMAVEIAAGQ